MEENIDNLTKGIISESTKLKPLFNLCEHQDYSIKDSDHQQQQQDITANYLPEGISNHNPICISVVNTRRSRPKSFKFCNTWAQHPQILARVAEVWSTKVDGHLMYQIVQTEVVEEETQRIEATIF
ncbi:hypothetical protein H5410_000636 [Solanum commersonii]|uniref:Uncharacterized protein n=1 Tax=Solanum commersonii TaxID=4109 RepID=A0A9J6AXT8_SOLCO|nr:hypothetical protein H5410_000636 [Solanum commersonii]